MSKKEEKKRRREDKAIPSESVIASNTRFKGNINADDTVRIAGHLEGDIQCEQLVRIDIGGIVVGTINSALVIIEGELNGNIESAKQVEIRSEGRAIGNIKTDELAIAEGSYIRGEINMSEKGKKPVSFVEKRDSGDQSNSSEEE
ncbi:MAG: polymer-forming cytoskeletal protein [Candidatus Aminicenantes bacterium]|nr:polymer-forming cytoskeletal protein [Candidatus Aminicenantes bacterium]